MEQAIEQLKAIPEDQQDRLAEFLLNELKEDERWARSTAEHEEKLKGLADSTLADEYKCVDADSAWREFRRVGERLAASKGPSITQAICDTRE